MTVRRAFLLRRAERDRVAAQGSDPDALRGTLLDPHGERNSAEDAKIDGGAAGGGRATSRGPGWALSCLGATAMAGGAIYGSSHGGRIGLLPEWGILDYRR